MDMKKKRFVEKSAQLIIRKIPPIICVNLAMLHVLLVQLLINHSVILVNLNFLRMHNVLINALQIII